MQNREPCSKSVCKQTSAHNLRGHVAYNAYCSTKNLEAGDSGFYKKTNKDKDSAKKTTKPAVAEALAAVAVQEGPPDLASVSLAGLPSNVVAINAAVAIPRQQMIKPFRVFSTW